ncbi:Hypothetical protein, putative [Bodo saltans]|uniref:Uncharacterized protein n=1 Tax=Bodo saltans TaxID=75058 RepID=A0A0S4IXE0_BODSA|nr:Hypothetical protein, putative [Bodo saltans]|eukprot:CUG39213.1 Hypothetical protein, putative [Bodo saltans]
MDGYGNVVYTTSDLNGVFRLGSTTSPFTFPADTVSPRSLTCDASTNIFYVAGTERIAAASLTTYALLVLLAARKGTMTPLEPMHFSTFSYSSQGDYLRRIHEYFLHHQLLSHLICDIYKQFICLVGRR